MIDIKALRENLSATSQRLARRGYTLDTSAFEQYDSTYRRLESAKQERQAQRKLISKQVGALRQQKGDASQLLDQVKSLDEQDEQESAALEESREKLQQVLLDIPNIPHESIPDGASEEENVELSRWGEPVEHAFKPQDHLALGEPLGLDIKTAAKMSGARFSLLWGDLARLHRSLIQFMLDMHTTEHGYTEMYVPSLVSESALIGTGQLPKFASDLFRIDQSDTYLIPTAEVPLANVAADRIFDSNSLPLKMVAQTPCYRSEAGSYGRDTRGIIRQHQFDKVELVQWVKAQDSDAALLELRTHAEAVLRALQLPYRVVELCCGDLGVSAARTYDLEVWLPSQGQYREVSSCSNCGDFQARRMKARWRGPDGTEFLHSLNGSGLAVGRTLVAVLENYQKQDGSVEIPAALVAYMRGQTLLEPSAQTAN